MAENDVGNVAALREALKAAKTLLENTDFDADSDLDDMAAPVMAKIGQALATPPRNCDVGTAYEQSVRMAEFCRAQYEKVAADVPLCSGCQFNNMEGDCQFAWAQMPYNGGDKC